MLNRMQKKYAGRPVRFLLVPCNQFAAQEPAPNSDIKVFAEKSVTLVNGGNVIMLAKSNLNAVPCVYAGADACTPASAACCPGNDGVYQTLLAETPPGEISWNFDKVVLGRDGAPFAGESVLHGEALDDTLSAMIDHLLLDTAGAGAEASYLAPAPAGGLFPACFAVAMLAGASVFAARSVTHARADAGCAPGEEATADYIRVA